MSSARPVTAASGMPPAMALAVVMRSGTTPFVVAGEPVAGAAEAGLDLVGDEQDPVGRAPLGDGREEAGCRDDEPALALDRLDQDAAGVVHADLALDLLDGPGGRLGAGHALGVAVGVRHGDPVDLGGERPEPVAVRHVLGRQRHGQVGAAVVGVVEGDDPVAPGDVAGDLDGVLDGLGAGVEQRGTLLVVTRGPGVELLAHGHVLLVRADHEAGVGESGDLLLDGVDHGRRGVAHADHGDARPEVDQGVAVDVDEDGPLGALDVEREDRADPGGHGRRAAGVERLRLGTGQIGDDSTCLVDPRGIHDSKRS